MFKTSLYLIIIFSLILSCDSGDDHDNSAFFSEIEDTDLVCSAGVVKSITPADEATSVSKSSAISVTFCDSIDPTEGSIKYPTNNSCLGEYTGHIQISSDDFATCKQINQQSISVTNSNKTISFSPFSDFSYNKTYKIKISKHVKKSSGDLIGSDYITSFTTERDPDDDITPPTVTSLSPAGGSTSVARSGNIEVTFNEKMDESSVNANTSNTECSATIQLSSNNFSSCIQMSTGASSEDGKRFTLSYADITGSTDYKIRITTGVKDQAGNPMSSQYELGSAFTTTAAQWVMQAYIKAANSDAEDVFGLYGSTVNGDTIAVGAPREKSNQTTITNGTSASSNNNSGKDLGAAYVYKRTGTSWAQEAYIKPANNNVSIQMNFGYIGTIISGDTLLVSGVYDASNQRTITNGTSASTNTSRSQSGAAFVYKRSGNSWTQEAYIKASNADFADRFASGIALDGDTIAVFAAKEDSNQTTITNGTGSSSNNSRADSGAVYVYKRTGSSWEQEAYIKAANTQSGNIYFGTPILDGDTLVATTQYEDSNQTTITNGTTASTNSDSDDSGAAYVYKRTGNSWAQEAYIKASNSEAGDAFGNSRYSAIDGDTLAVGAGGEDSNQNVITNGTTASSDNSNTSSGAVYVYKRTGTSWAQEAYIKPSNSDAGDGFGGSVSISGNLLAVGAAGEDSNQVTITNGSTASSNNDTSNSGAVYIFERTGTSWAQVAYIKAPNPDVDDNFGQSVSLDNKTLLVTSKDDSNQTTITTTANADNSNTNSGAAYVFVLQ